MADTRSRPKAARSAAGQAAKDIVKAAAGEKKAESKLGDAGRVLRAALDALTNAKVGSADERKARKVARAAVDALVTAKRKLKKAQKKVRKVAAKQVKPTARTGTSATTKPKSGPAAGAGGKSRKASALTHATQHDEKQVEDQEVAKAAAGTSNDALAGGLQPDEAGHTDF